MRLGEFLNEEQGQERDQGEMDLFQDSLRIVFGLDAETIETLVDIVRRHGDTMQIRDQQVRRRAGGRAVELLKQAHEASRSEGDEQYDDKAELRRLPSQTKLMPLRYRNSFTNICHCFSL